MKYLPAILFLVVVFSCRKVPENCPDPIACFTWLPDTLIYTGDSIHFKNCSENSDHYLWSFGLLGTSTAVEPTHIFNTKGEFSVTLIACKDEKTDTLIRHIEVIEMIKEPIACFTWLPDTLIHVGDTVRFKNCSENSGRYDWAFGDEGTSQDTEPTHIFTSIGEFEVTLTAYGNQNVSTLTLRIGVSEQPDRIIFSDLPEPIIRTTVQSFRWESDSHNPGFRPTPPDSSTFVELDVNNDKQNDFIINLSHHPQEPPYYGSGDGYTFLIQIVGLSNADSIAHTTYPNVAGYYAEAEPIPFNSSWSSKGVLSLRGFPMEFKIEGNYIGFKHNNSVGWIKIKALDLNGIAVENFAINLTGERQILAGQKE